MNRKIKNFVFSVTLIISAVLLVAGFLPDLVEKVEAISFPCTTSKGEAGYTDVFGNCIPYPVIGGGGGSRICFAPLDYSFVNGVWQVKSSRNFAYALVNPLSTTYLHFDPTGGPFSILDNLGAINVPNNTDAPGCKFAANVILDATLIAGTTSFPIHYSGRNSGLRAILFDSILTSIQSNAVSTEDAVINHITTTGSVTVRLSGRTAGGQANFPVQMTNCVNLSGSGATAVLMRKTGSTSTVADFKTAAQTYATAHPGKNYYLDLKRQNPVGFTSAQSSCGAVKNQYIFIDTVAPSITSVSPTSIAPGATLTITGSGFALAGNTISFTNATSSQVTTVPNISSNGSTLTVTVPASLSVGNYTVSVKGLYTAGSNSVNLEIAQDCQLVSGTGPKKVVFMRGASWTASKETFLSQVNNVINNGFKKIDPLKKYQDQFSFYVDLKKYDDSGFPVLEANGQRLGFRASVVDGVKSGSSCASSVGTGNQHIFFVDRSDLDTRGFAPTASNGLVFLNLNPGGEGRVNDLDISLTAVHEFGHSFASLLDEYIAMEPVNLSEALPTGRILANCALNPAQDYKSSIDGKIYGSLTTRGCTCENTGSSSCSPYYRPSDNSIMNVRVDSNTDVARITTPKFNVISCGYVIAAIKGESVTKANAEKYWPECTTLDVVENQNPKNLTAVMEPIGKVKLNWTGVSGADYYEISRAQDDILGGFTDVANVEGDLTSYTDDLNSLIFKADNIFYRIRAVFPGQIYSDYVTSDLISSCPKISGNGPKKVVFMAGKSIIADNDAFIRHAKTTIAEGFKAIDPYKTYIDRFSFYIDLKRYDHTNSPTYSFLSHDGLKFLTLAVGEDIKNKSSCYGVDGIENKASQYFFYLNDPKLYLAWAPYHKIAFLNEAEGYIGPKDAMHEMGHTFAGLMDEHSNSYFSLAGWISLLPSEDLKIARNCSQFPSQDYRNPVDNKIYGQAGSALGYSFLINGCSGELGILGRWYRPSLESLMKDQEVESRPNVISCGYIMASIFEPRPSSRSAYRKMAAKYWPECLTLDTVEKSGGILPLELPAPTIHPPARQTSNLFRRLLASVFAALSGGVPADTYSGSPGSTVSISGSGFSSTDNAVNLTNNSTSEVFEVLELTSNGMILNFAIPTSTPPGAYTLKIGAFNSPWSNPLPFTVLALKSGPTLTSLSPTSVSPGSSIVAIGSGFATSTNTDRVELTFATSTYSLTAMIRPTAGSVMSPPTGIAIDSGRYTTFQLPNNIPSGTYSVKIANQDSDWSNALTLTVPTPVPGVVRPINALPIQRLPDTEWAIYMAATASTTVATTTVVTTTVSTFCYTFNRDLGVDLPINEQEVSALKSVFSRERLSGSSNFTIYDESVASKIIEIQRKYSVPLISGYLGPLTRTKLNQMYGCGR